MLSEESEATMNCFPRQDDGRCYCGDHDPQPCRECNAPVGESHDPECPNSAEVAAFDRAAYSEVPALVASSVRRWA